MYRRIKELCFPSMGNFLKFYKQRIKTNNACETVCVNEVRCVNFQTIYVNK